MNTTVFLELIDVLEKPVVCSKADLLFLVIKAKVLLPAFTRHLTLKAILHSRYLHIVA